MSDSDDTDILLLIPPDFFNIETSDTELSNYENDGVERSVVNDLISHVNELENRITQIECKDSSHLNESLSSMNSSHSSNFLHGEMNSATHHLGSDPSINISPSRRIARFNSLPPTPSSYSHRSLAPSLSTSRTWGRNHSSPSKALSRSQRSLLGSNWESTYDDKLKGNSSLSEVDLFLDGLKRDNTSSKSNKEKELVAGALPPSPQKRDTAHAVGHLQLDEVDRLLKEVEAEQKSIEARLSSHDSPEVRRIVRKPGETIGSIPDHGFGVRDKWRDGKPGETIGSVTDHGVGVHDKWKDVDHFLQGERNQRAVDEAVVTARKQYQLGDNVGSIPDLGFGVRESWADSASPAKQNKNVTQSKPYQQSGEAPVVPRTAAILQSESNTPPKQSPKMFASRRKLHLDQLAKQRPAVEDMVEQDTSLESFSSSNDPFGGMKSKRSVIYPSTGEDQTENHTTAPKTLLSLAELWSDGEGSNVRQTGDIKLLQKYEEERCRRQHCEQLVQALQTKLLESQQKLAVALQVDCDKDAAISKLQGAWNSLVQHWRSLEEQRHSLTKQLQDQKLTSESQIKRMQEKMERYETELSKALDLAHGYKEQSENAEHMHSSQMEQLANKVQELERRLAAAILACSEANQKEDVLQKQVYEDHKKLSQLQEAMDEATKALTSQEADVAVLAEEKCALQARLKEEKARLETQQHSRDKLNVELEEVKKRERNLQTELRKTSEQLDIMKTELHDFYQAQLERVVRDKLKEFQAQLDAAESALQRELESRERNVAQLAARQLQHVTEKHKLEVSLLEQKHGEELRLMQLQLSKASRQIQDLETRLAAYDKRSSTLAERLHGVMENQWREALSIISNPNEKEGQAQNNTTKLNNGGDTAWMLVQQQQQHQQQSQSQLSNHSSVDENPFSRDGQVTHRTATPIQQQLNKTQDSDDLRKYIKMLLDRAPGNPIDSEQQQNLIGGKNSQAAASVTNSSQLKPPWK